MYIKGSVHQSGAAQGLFFELFCRPAYKSSVCYSHALGKRFLDLPQQCCPDHLCDFLWGRAGARPR